MKLWKCVVLLLLLLMGSATEVHAHDPSGISYILPFYAGASKFTLVPACTGAVISAVPGAVIGGGGYVIGYAAGLPFGKEDDFAESAFQYPLVGITMLGGAVAGSPFYLLEKVFYDFPRYLLESDEQAAR